MRKVEWTTVFVVVVLITLVIGVGGGQLVDCNKPKDVDIRSLTEPDLTQMLFTKATLDTNTIWCKDYTQMCNLFGELTKKYPNHMSELLIKYNIRYTNKYGKVFGVKK